MKMDNNKQLNELSEEMEGQLTVDVYQTPDEIIVESTIAGVNADEIDLNVTSEMVTIRGERKRENRVEEGDYFYQECFWGRFSRSIILPQEIDPEKTHSVVKKGILTIHLPKLNRSKGKKIKIRTGEEN